MATVAALPSTLRDKINSLARKIALLRLTRTIAVTALVLMLSAGFIWLADSWLRMPRGARIIALGGWCVLAIFGIVRCLRSLSHKADADALAALIEQEYPNLAERLLTSVELTEAAENAHGSRTLIDLLVRETEIRASSLNFLQAAPEKPAYRLAGLAAGFAALILIPAAIWPSSYVGELQRFFLPWRQTPIPYEIATNPGDFAIARGQSLILTANIRATGQADSLPNSATLVMTNSDGKTIRLGMKSDQPQVFFVKLNSVADSFRFTVEAGEAASAEHQVTAVDPVQLLADSPSITITPPAYAGKAVETKTITGLGDFSALQYGRLAFQFRFTKPARKAVLEWTPLANGEAPIDKSKSFKRELQLSDGGQSAKTDWSVLKPGKFNLVLEAEHGIRTELPPQSLNVIVDRPPAFVKVSGTTEQLRSVNAVETVPLDLTLADDYGVEKAEVEFRVNEGKIQTEAMNLDGLGTPQAIGTHLLKLAGKVKEGDNLQFRLRIADNRHVPEARLNPHVVYHPAENRWFTLKIARSAEPLKQQEILAQRDDIRKRLEALISELNRERNKVYKVQQEAKREAKMNVEVAQNLREARSDHQANERTLNDLSRDVALTPELRPLANRLQDVSDQEMHNTSAALQQAEKERSAVAPRDKELVKADTELEKAIKKLEGLQKENDQVAQQRLDQMRLEQLAERQKQLAEQLAQETDPQKAKQIAEEQQRLKDELKKITQESEPLKQAMDAVQAEKNRELADKARELAQAQRDLEQAMKQTNQDANKKQLADLAKKQRELADKAERLAKETQQPSKAAQSRPLDADKPKEAADALDKGDANQALTKQEQTAQDLDRLANELDRAIQLAKDPREAARQLARLQEDLKNRTANEDRKTPLAEMPRQRLEDLRKDQQAIKQAAETLSVPEANRDAQRDKQQAIEHAQKAAEQLANKNHLRADAEMTQARQALDRLADRLPTLTQRLNQAREEVGKLRRQQDQITQQAEQAVKQAERQNTTNPDQIRRDLSQKLADASQKQADLADKLARLDIPTHEDRQQKTQEAANKALQDLLSARPQDIPASQGESRRQLERLEQALNGQKPVDEKAADLARRQEKLAEQARKLAANNKSAAEKSREMQQVQNEQRQIAQEASALPRTEASQRQAEAQEAAKQAEQAAKQNSPELAKKSEEAAKALQRLADQLQGKENNAEKADRLAKKQKELADEADHLAKKPDAKAQNDLKQQQQRLQDEAKQLRGGEQAALEKQKADDALSLLSRTPPDKLPAAQRQAADALHNLADRLNRKNDAELAKEPPLTPQQLAQKQRELAQQTQQARKEAGQNAQRAQEATQQLARRQAELSRQAERTPANGQAQQMQQARQAMNQAERSLARGDWEKAQQSQQQAAKALEQLTQQANNQRPNSRPNANAQQQASNLPNRNQVDQARQLAQQQRDLRDAVQQAMNQLQANQNQPPKDNPLGELAKEQQSIAQAAQQMARQQAQQNGQQAQQTQQAQQAAKAAQQAANQLQAGAPQQAKQSGQQAAQQMQQMAQNGRGDGQQQAQQLARRQEAVNRQLEHMANSTEGSQAQQRAQQQSLQQQAQDLAQQMQQQANQTRNPQAQQSMRQATQSTQQANQAMQQAQRNQQQGNQAGTQQSQERAAQDLDRASQLAQQAAQSGQQQGQGQAQPGQPQQDAGQALQQAQNQMGNAQRQLGQQQRPQARNSMQNAAQSLQQAAQSLAQQQGQPNGQPPRGQTRTGNNDGGANNAAIDLAKYGKEAKKFQGRPWGELPGELRTRIIQDMRAQYGDDYGKMIKLYFEQLADKK